MAIQWGGRKNIGYRLRRCVLEVGMLSGMPGPDEGEIGSAGDGIGRARCLEACLGVTAGVKAQARRCCSCGSLHETTNLVGEEETHRQGEEVYSGLGRVALE